MSKTKTTTNTKTADPLTLQREKQMWDRASDLASQPYQSYGGNRVAGFSGMQNQGFDATNNAVGMGQGAVNLGIGAATGASQYNPMMVNAMSGGMAAQAPNAQNVTQATQLAMNSVQQAGARDVRSQDAAGGMDQYTNPYTNQVVDASLNDLDRQRQMAIQQGQAQAQSAGAFGGSRHGVADSLTNEAAMREAGMLGGQLRSQGFNTALGAATNDANRDLSAQQGNQMADVNTSIANANNSASLANQGLSQQGAVGMFNAGQQNNMSQFNAQQDLAGQQSNQGAGLSGNAQHLAAGNSLNNMGQTQQNMGLTGANALMNAGGMQQGLEQAKLNTSYQDWVQKQNDPYKKLQFQQGFKGTEGTTTTDKTKGSVLGGILGAVSTIAGGPIGGMIGKGLSGLLGGKDSQPQPIGEASNYYSQNFA